MITDNRQTDKQTTTFGLLELLSAAKKNIFLLTFVNKDFTPPLIIDEKPLRFRGPVRGVTPPPFIKVKNNIV